MAIKQRIDLLFSFSFFVLLMRPCCSQTDKLLPGQLLKDGDELVSAFGNFRMGFFSPDGSENRYLGVWYYRPTDPSVLGGYNSKRNKPVWVANRNNPILDKSGSLAIDSNDGNLKILLNGGNPIVITSVKAEGNTSATLLKTGNLVLYEMNSDGSERLELWQSFDYPTDTLLPGMKLGINLQTGHEWFLQSWISDISPAQGSYTLGIDPNVSNRLIIRWRGDIIYWTKGIWLNGEFDFLGLVSDGYNFSYASNEHEKYFNYSASETITSFPELRLTADGLRGALSVPCLHEIQCVSVSVNVKRPRCRKDFSKFEYKYGFMNGDGFKFKESDNMTLSDCEVKCFQNCSCVAYASINESNDTGCEIWSSGTKFTETSFTDDHRIIFMAREPKEKKWWLWLIVAIAAAIGETMLCLMCYLARRKYKGEEEKKRMSLAIAVGAALLIPLLCYLCYLILRKLKAKVENIVNRQKLLRELGDNASLPTIFGNRKTQANKDQTMKRDLKIFDFQTIAAATDNFSPGNRLGQGGFGPVYKGKLLDGQEIAIKRLSKSSGQGIVEFKNEAKLIAKLQHTNLVRLLGCSLQKGERLLVYEYLPNKSLDFFIFDSSKKELLDWKKRFNIIEGIVQGLLYLHKYSRLRVIHRDLKASNILLDDQMNPKISDFGMARTFGMNELEANTNRIVGTHGYMSPEYVMNGIVSMKSDVYSFGVLVLEIISSKKNNGCYDTERHLNLVGYAWQLWNEGKALELIDTTLHESCSPDEVTRCIHVGLLCVQDKATDRPTMSDVASMLTNDTMALPTPRQPAFFINISSDYEEPEVTEIKLEVCSVNDVTISRMEAR
ncbi:G-type lectin S-receptor-like serine/threonine-protein kinase [Citrus sinensis]|uniref:G-type lectin S-receptor-like serine/threonine-protein kinase n=1 Tax=Citrus sinensis TaxID=2711 RepID=A0ACB8J9Q9_CITSI|nr:G-type lectin S-receptor-like serine/threonine-protein kinase [Citrus sinensis]